jgi:hypothetical protein
MSSRHITIISKASHVSSSGETARGPQTAIATVCHIMFVLQQSLRKYEIEKIIG